MWNHLVTSSGPRPVVGDPQVNLRTTPVYRRDDADLPGVDEVLAARPTFLTHP
jgi:hypothetical protein